MGTAPPREPSSATVSSSRQPNYLQINRYHVAEHTIDRVFTALGAHYIELPEESPRDSAIQSPPDLFVGYLLLDALIGNTDRHHENWAILDSPSDNRRQAVLSPTFDHASSLAHVLTDEERARRLTTRDRGYSVAAFVAKARSALYRVQGDPVRCARSRFSEAENRRADAGTFWRERLGTLDAGILEDIVSRVPDEIMSQTSKEFALALLTCNRANPVCGGEVIMSTQIPVLFVTWRSPRTHSILPVGRLIYRDHDGLYEFAYINKARKRSGRDSCPSWTSRFRASST